MIPVSITIRYKSHSVRLSSRDKVVSLEERFSAILHLTEGKPRPSLCQWLDDIRAAWREESNGRFDE